VHTNEKQVGATLQGWRFHVPNWRPSSNGPLFERVKKQGAYIIYKDFMPEYISCQYSHLVVATRIHLTEIKVKQGEPKRWKMSEVDHDSIMETCIPITHWPDE